jgi:hypothetical protein
VINGKVTCDFGTPGRLVPFTASMHNRDNSSTIRGWPRIYSNVN